MKTFLGVIRLPFLILAPACVFLGLAVAVYYGGVFSAWQAALVFIGGVAAHMCVNALNEYEDIKSGLDLRTSPTPFSGGSGTLRKDPSKANIALITGIACAAIATAIGGYFFFVSGWPIIVIGLIGLFIIVAYTPLFNHQPLLCLLAPGVGFGTLMVLGSFDALAGKFNLAAALASFIPFFLVSNLLLLNQFPDVEADKTVGRRHFPILIGRKASAIIFTAFTAGAYLAIILGVVFKLFPVWCLLGLGTLIFAIPAVRGALAHPDELQKLMPSLGMNVLLNVLTPVLVGVGFLIK